MFFQFFLASDKLKDSQNNLNTDPLSNQLEIMSEKQIDQEEEITRLKEEIEKMLSEKIRILLNN